MVGPDEKDPPVRRMYVAGRRFGPPSPGRAGPSGEAIKSEVRMLVFGVGGILWLILVILLILLVVGVLRGRA